MAARSCCPAAMLRRLVLAGLFAATASHVGGETGRDRLLAAYLELGSQYQSGDADRAVATYLRWPRSDVDDAVSGLFHARGRLRPCRERPEAISSALVESLVLLHLDAMRWPHPGAPRIPPPWMREADLARTIFDWLTSATEGWPTATDQGLRSGCPHRPRLARHEFYFILSGFLLGRSEPEAALRAALAGLEPPHPGVFQHERAPETPLRLAAASAHEMRAWMLRTHGGASGWNDVRDPQARALAMFKDLLERDPGCVAARLRRGRLLWLAGHLPEAEAELRQAAEAPEPATRYLAELFVGGMLEQRADTAGALEAYRRAQQVLPLAQTARLACARLMALGGQAAEARSVIEEPLAQPWTTKLGDDPWWQYPFGVWPEAEHAFVALRRRLAED